MRLVGPDGAVRWLAYGMNVHPGGSPEVLEEAIRTTVDPLRERLDVDGPFGLAVRLDRDGVDALLEDDERCRLLGDLLRAQDLVPFTGNAFVVGAFHDAGTKASVYRPTWDDPAREAYTVGFARVLAAWSAPGAEVSLSTSPLSFKPFGGGAGLASAAARRLVATASALADLADETGVRVRLALEPEPLCTLETTDEAVAFFAGPLAAALDAAPRARAHLGVCYDVCHQAVEGEDPEAGLAALAAAGIAVAKVQLSCALVVPDPSSSAHRAAVARFDEGRWLHQVAAGGGTTPVRRAADLPEVLTGPDAAAWAAAGPWRVHCHVPVHLEALTPPLRTTQPVLARALRAVARPGLTSHLEIETYTFDGLPPEVRAGGLVASLAKEYAWVLARLREQGIVPMPEEDDA
ncbi:MAG: metabolite traffic protein EboE [Planctomycetota bacterium]